VVLAYEVGINSCKEAFPRHTKGLFPYIIDDVSLGDMRCSP